VLKAELNQSNRRHLRARLVCASRSLQVKWTRKRYKTSKETQLKVIQACLNRMLHIYFIRH